MPMVLSTYSLIYDREFYPIPGTSTVLSYNKEHDLFICPVPGPDMICVFDPKMVGIQQFKPGLLKEISIFPNPASDQVIIESESEILRVKVCNLAGIEVYSGDYRDKTVSIPTNNLAPGMYVIDVVTVEGRSSRKMVIRG
jgi:hypothetical protein